MGLFDRNDYDRDYGGRAGGMGRGYDRDLGDRAADGLRRGWNHLRNGAHDSFHAGGHPYDRDMGGTWNSPFGNAYGRDPGMGNRGRMWGESGQGMTGNRSGWSFGAYEREYGFGGSPMGNEGGRMPYDAEYGGGYGGMSGGYDGDYKSRRQTNQGDPFGDRARNTPMRMMRGGFRNDQGSQGYDRDYDRGRGMMGRDRGYDIGYRGGDRGYDSGWF